MINRIVELQQTSSELLSDIEDILHATSINMRGACSEVSHPSFATLQQQFEFTQGLLSSIKQLVKSREEFFMNFLITKQIQEQETKVRRERLSQYEQKIYDQKRIIAEKEIFFESLLRPKRKRPPNQTTEQFQQARARERQIQQKIKTDQLVKEMIDFQSFRRLLEQQQRLKRKMELQSTKESSESHINLTLTNLDTTDIATQRFIYPKQKGVKQNPSSHKRVHSAKHGLSKQLTILKKQDSQSDLDIAQVLLEQISKLCQQNEKIHRIYDQQVSSFNFKKNLKAKGLKQYQKVANSIKNVRNQFVNIKRYKNWMYERVYEPPVYSKKRSDSN